MYIILKLWHRLFKLIFAFNLATSISYPPYSLGRREIILFISWKFSKLFIFLLVKPFFRKNSYIGFRWISSQVRWKIASKSRAYFLQISCINQAYLMHISSKIQANLMQISRKSHENLHEISQKSLPSLMKVS